MLESYIRSEETRLQNRTSTTLCNEQSTPASPTRVPSTHRLAKASATNRNCIG